MNKGKKRVRFALAAVLLAAAGTCSFYGYAWYRAVPLERFVVTGNHHAESDALVDLTALDTVRFIYEVDAELVSDRVRRHPWVRAANVTRWPTGTLQIKVEERIPVLVALGRTGEPRYLIDEEGYTMALVDTHYNVPLLHGAAAPEHPLRPLGDGRVQELAGALSTLDDAQQALISEFELRDGEAWLRTTATDGGHSLHVRLGRDGFAEKLNRFHAFWHQAVLTQPGTRFELLDLRFDSQIITREHLPEETELTLN